MSRLFLDIFIFLSRHPLLTFAVLLALWILAVRFFPIPRKLHELGSRIGPRPLFLVVGFLVVLYLAISVWYLQLPGFAGEVEPLVTSVSWMIQDGHPLYHEVESSSRYSVLYGPSVFLTNGLFLRVLGPSLLVAKLVSALAGLGSLVFLFAAVAGDRQAAIRATAVTGLAVLFYWSQGFAVYLVRPDALLLFSVGLGLYATVKTPRWLAVLALGTILGFAVNLKIHAWLYFLPVLVLLGERFGRKAIVQAVAWGLFITLAPFVLHPGISLTNYVAWLRVASEHGLVWSAVPPMLAFWLGMLTPTIAVLWMSSDPEDSLKRRRSLLLSLLVSSVALLVVAAKPGAGLVHLLPLVIPYMYVLSEALREARPLAGFARREPLNTAILGQGAALAMVVAVFLAGTIHEYRICRFVHWENRDSRDMAGDIARIQSALPGMSLGMAVGGEDANFRMTWLRPLLVFNHSPLLIDPIAVMDCCLSGQTLSANTYSAISEGEVDVWLVPRQQEPFAKINWYKPHDPIFPPEFKEHFKANYTPRSSSQYFDLWMWNGLRDEGAAGAPTPARPGADAVVTIKNDSPGP
jgi:hypothetical protein